MAASGLSCGMQDLFIAARRLFVAAHGLLSSCGTQAAGCVGSVVCRPQPLHVPCIVRCILYHWTTREVPK